MTSHDKWFDRWNASNTSAACVVRVTNQCNQQCIHCAFRSGPKYIDHMSTATCEEINRWIPSKIAPNIMGGEITVLRDYPEMLIALAKDRDYIRIVTNGQWSRKSRTRKKFVTAMSILAKICKTVDVAVSTDKWHDRIWPDALDIIRTECPNIVVIDPGHLDKTAIVPIGRAWDNNLALNSEKWTQCTIMTNMIISENGMICRCPFGYFPWKHFTETSWHEAQEYVWRWRSEQLNEGMTCDSCMKRNKSTKRQSGKIYAYIRSLVR